MHRIHLVDASLYIFRAWHSQPPDIADGDGHPVNALHGFARFLLDLLERENPSHIAVAFDESLQTSFRNRLYPPYKANREPAPESLKRQFAACQQFTSALGLTVLKDPHYEADDLIGTLLMRQRARGFSGVLISADKDLSQLLGPGDLQWDYPRSERWDAAGVKSRHGVHAHQMADYLGLAGDASDNIPGVPGIGAKTAAALLEHFGSLDALLLRLDELPFLRLRGAASHARRLREHTQLALLSRQLATIACDAPLPEDIADGERRAGNPAVLDDLLEHARFGPLTRRRATALVHSA